MSAQTVEAGASLPPRRLDHDARRRQLIAAATALVARQGSTQLSLEGVARRAGVTRNLIYHYFPRGRPDLVAAVVRAAEEQLLTDWMTEWRQGLEPAGARILDHALAPTHAWRIHRLARAVPDPDLTAITDEILTHGLTELAADRGWGKTPLALIALRGYVAFAETVLDEGRRGRVARQQLAGLLRDTFEALPIEDPANPKG